MLPVSLIGDFENEYQGWKFKCNDERDTSFRNVYAYKVIDGKGKYIYLGYSLDAYSLNWEKDLQDAIEMLKKKINEGNFVLHDGW